MIDKKCIQLRLPENVDKACVVGFLPKGHVGNVAKEISAFLQPLMRHPFGSVACIGDNTHYGSGYFFSCVLSYENFNHTPQGYAIDIIVHTSNSHAWIDELYSKLCEHLEISAIRRI